MKQTQFVAIAAASILLAGAALAAPETLRFDSVTPNGPTQLVRREYPATRTSIPGQLYMPANASGRVPAMVIKHGSGGVSDARETAWAGRLNAIGIAGFVVDSFGPRGVKSTAEDQSQLAIEADIADALAALRALARDPRIDPQRIGVMGFSRGGQAALYTAIEPIRKGVIDDDTRFAAIAAFYPGCNARYVSGQTGTAPIGLFHGEADDYTLAAACRDYVEWFRGKGAPVTVRLYPGAFHNFDVPGPVITAARVQTGRACNFEINFDVPSLRRLDTGAALDRAALSAYIAACRQLGARIGGNPAALNAAIKDLGDFLKASFKLP